MPWDKVTQLFSADTKLLGAAVISAVVSAVVSLLLKTIETRDKLAAEYEYEQRKKIKELIGRYHGRLVHAANSLNCRMWNLYNNEGKGWLDADGRYNSNCGYYMVSFVHRVLNVCALIRQFEKEAIFLDARIAKKEDFVFMNYLDAIHWVMTDVALFKELEYDSTLQKDHFFADRLRSYSDMCWMDGDIISQEDLTSKIKTDRSLDGFISFFDNLKKEEPRLRWDRLVALHLLLLCFLNRFGYKTQRSSKRAFSVVIGQFRNRRVLTNLATWLPKLGLDKDKESKIILKLK
jgi:hypothetical protein